MTHLISKLIESTNAHPCPQCGQGGKCIQLADDSAGICGADACAGHIHFWGDAPVVLMLADMWLMTFKQDGNQRHKTRGPSHRDKLRARRQAKKLRRQGKEIRDQSELNESSNKDAGHDH
jgi:hypothetical protein